MRKKKILWFEDEPGYIKYTKKLLEYEGFEIVLSSDVGDFFNELERNKDADLLMVDLIISKQDPAKKEQIFGKKDIYPTKVGLEVIRKLLRDGIKIPILVLTVVSDETDIGREIYQEIWQLSKKFGVTINLIQKTESVQNIIKMVKETMRG